MPFRAFPIIITILFHHIPITICQFDYSGAQFTTATQSSLPLLPFSNRYMVAGVWNKSIFLLCGFDNSKIIKSFVEWDTTKEQMINYGLNYLPYESWISAQGWTQQGEILYMIEPYRPISSQDSIRKFNLRTKQFVTSYTVNIPIQVGSYGGCLASYANYLYVLGGTTTAADPPFAITQVFNMSSNSWVPNAPKMHFTRHSLTCIVHPDRKRLYAIGGRIPGSIYRSSIEMIAVDTDIRYAQWFNNTYDLIRGVSITRSVVYGDDILVIGGKEKADQSTAMQIINTITGEVSIEPNALQYKTGAFAVAILDGILYAFGGWQGAEIDDWQYYTLPQIAQATSDPTSPPSNYPTSHPSDSPTDNPSDAPTSTTLEPSTVPTIMPSTSPSLLPTSSPTKPPALSPTLSPTSPPTYNPTIEPITAVPVITTMAPTTYIVSTQMEELNEGRVDEANNTGDNKSRNTQPSSNFNDDPVLTVVIYTAIAMALAAVICVLLRFLYKRKTRRKETEGNMQRNEADHQNVVDDVDAMGAPPGVEIHHGSVDMKPPGMAKDSLDISYDKSVRTRGEKKKRTRRLLVDDNVKTNMNGGEKGEMDDEQTVEGVQDVAQLPPLPNDTEDGQTTKGHGVTPHDTKYVDGNTDTGSC